MYVLMRDFANALQLAAVAVVLLAVILSFCFELSIVSWSLLNLYFHARTVWEKEDALQLTYCCR